MKGSQNTKRAMRTRFVHPTLVAAFVALTGCSAFDLRNPPTFQLTDDDRACSIDADFQRSVDVLFDVLRRQLEAYGNTAGSLAHLGREVSVLTE